MPRLSVDIDLTYIHTEDRKYAMLKLKEGLTTIQNQILQNIRGAKVNFQPAQLKLQISRAGAVVKIEVNQGIRGVMDELDNLVLCDKAQEDFDAFCTIKGVSIGQFYGGKICAALDRQHPRDLFDGHYMLENKGITTEIKKGFLFTLLSSGRAMYDILFPNKIDQLDAFHNQFEGMTSEPFSYADFEKTRDRLLSLLHKSLSVDDRKFIVAFKNGTPNWNYLDFQKFPAIQWKLQNILHLKNFGALKHKKVVIRLREKLEV